MEHHAGHAQGGESLHQFLGEHGSHAGMAGLFVHPDVMADSTSSGSMKRCGQTRCHRGALPCPESIHRHGPGGAGASLRRGVLRLRRIEIELDTPTEDGDTVLRLLTHVPADRKGATTLARLYRTRWRIEFLFGRLESGLESKVRGLGSPRGALLGFCVALVAYDVLALWQAAVRTAHPVCEEKPISPFDIAAGSLGAKRKPDIGAIGTDAGEMARHVDPVMLLKHSRGPKPRKKKGYAPGSEVRRQAATSSMAPPPGPLCTALSAPVKLRPDAP